MSEKKLEEIKARVKDGVPEDLKKDIEWLIERVGKLESDNSQLKGAVEFLKKELQYQDYQGEAF
ncbi:MAG: hypothetical protein ACK2TU_09830 [Anaerolineales bacterium]|jgi:hypothetical protein